VTVKQADDYEPVYFTPEINSFHGNLKNISLILNYSKPIKLELILTSEIFKKKKRKRYMLP